MSSLSHVQLFVTPWTITHVTPLSMGFSRQEYWSGMPRPPPGDCPNPGMEPMSLMSPALAGRFFTASATWEAPSAVQCRQINKYYYRCQKKKKKKEKNVYCGFVCKRANDWKQLKGEELQKYRAPISRNPYARVCARSFSHVGLCDPTDWNSL